ncbi:DUF3445 domain-containing protein [Rhizobiales bacterium]|uniref:heme-dependent oxidative N-demethylase family protein n=1 Tax=Hongsoonwoonella zoysiae TaxID=2821844 RepID=UPI0015616B66|nr:DUF3445 domain-containing protein [Hongsoonwoonella zoysiae]NRG17308.1 DUF3445 domain-containing protein [Hongsoonwoonella zoysiae]
MTATGKADSGDVGVRRKNAPFAHTPYDGSKRPFTVGLAPLDLAEWIEPDGNLKAHLQEKERLFREAEAPVFLAEPDTVAAQAEVLALLLEHLPARYPDLYSSNGDEIRIVPTGKVYSKTDFAEAPLLLAARLVQEDLVIMRKGEGGYRLVAASLSFPSSWSLAEKFGKPMPEIHENVPGFNDGRMGTIVARLFDNLSVDQPSWRLNWSLYTDAELHHPHSKRIDPRIGHGSSGSLHVRVERQTLRRLPYSGDILFTIKVHHDPVAAFAKHLDGARLALSLRDQVLALDADQLAYKGLTESRDAIVKRLEGLASRIG